MNPLELTGRIRTHIRQYDEPRFAAHPEAARSFFGMAEAARKSGIELHPFSAFRDFDSQIRIWNLKFSGKRILYDEKGKAIDPTGFDQHQMVRTILNWTALPGASRHHWGTDIDVIDTLAIPNGYQIRLLPEETVAGGVFFKLHRWLDRNMDRYGFFRPYTGYGFGFNAEPWHLSYAEVSRQALADLTVDILAESIETSEIMGKSAILDMLSEIYETYVLPVAG